MHRATHKLMRRGFTITELIVSLTIAGLMAGITIPAMTSLARNSKQAVAVNSVASTVAAARAYAIRDMADLQSTHIDDPEFDGFTYSGAAAVFTPAREIRLVENDQLARNGNNTGYLEPKLNGYRDIPNRDYTRLPSGVGVVGLARGGTPIGTLLLTPPFAIRFDSTGKLIAAQPTGVSAEHAVRYDGNYNGLYRSTVERDSIEDYNPDLWDPDRADAQTTDSPGNNFARLPDGRYTLPYDALEAVVGVVLYSDGDLRAAVSLPNPLSALDASGKLDPQVEAWILENGRVMLFDRYSGRELRKGS